MTEFYWSGVAFGFLAGSTLTFSVVLGIGLYLVHRDYPRAAAVLPSDPKDGA